MVTLISKAITTFTVVFIAVLYQFFIKGIIFNTLGYGRAILSLKDFPHAKCEKIENLGLEACEDMWLHDETGFLYMACSNLVSRTHWLPAIDRLNASGHGVRDRLAIMDTRGPGSLSSRLKFISTENFSGNNGDGHFNLHGLDIRADKSSGMLRILLINHRPPVDPITGVILDAKKYGANSTIEQFLTKVGSSTMLHIKTYAHPVIETPNSVAWITEQSFVFSNDNHAKTGIKRKLVPLIGGGSVGYCDQQRCLTAKSSGFRGSNGIVHGHDGLIYVANTLGKHIDVFKLNEQHILTLEHRIPVTLPIDNLRVDKNGDIYAAAFPKLYKWLQNSKLPFQKQSPSTVLRIRSLEIDKEPKGSEKQIKGQGKRFVVEKILEDDGGEILPSSTVAVHDVSSGRIFLGGVTAPFITICETR